MRSAAIHQTLLRATGSLLCGLPCVACPGAEGGAEAGVTTTDEGSSGAPTTTGPTGTAAGTTGDPGADSTGGTAAPTSGDPGPDLPPAIQCDPGRRIFSARPVW